MGKLLDMCCCFCEKQVEQVENIGLDKSGNVIVMCDSCYEIALNFFSGGGTSNVESRQHNKRSK